MAKKKNKGVRHTENRACVVYKFSACKNVEDQQIVHYQSVKCCYLKPVNAVIFMSGWMRFFASKKQSDVT